VDVGSVIVASTVVYTVRRMRLSVLLADPDPRVILYVRQALWLDVPNLETTMNGEVALGLLRKWRPELAIVAIGFPDRPPSAMITPFARGSSRKGTTRFIALLEAGDGAGARAAVEAGAEFTLMKPPDEAPVEIWRSFGRLIEALAASLDRVMSRPESGDEPTTRRTRRPGSDAAATIRIAQARTPGEAPAKRKSA